MHVLVVPMTAVPVQSAPYDAAYPEGPASETEYAPALSMTVVPSSEPGKLAGDGAEPVTDIVNMDAVARPPLSLTMCLITISFGWTSLFVTVHVFVVPMTAVPVQSAPYDAAYPDGPVSDTSYEPAFSPTVVPDSAPWNEAGEGLVPVTVIVKSPATAVPPLSLTTCLITINLGWTSSFVTVHVFVSPMTAVPVQSADKLAA